MPDDGTSPSGGWREVYAAMDVSPSVEPPDEDDARPCPDCRVRSPRVAEHRYRCPHHGVWRPADA